MGQSRDDVAPWGQHTNRIAHIGEKVNPWSCSHPEFTWERTREVFFPNSGTVGLSGTPYGQVDVVGVDDQTRLADLSRYSLLAFGGWNTMTKRQASLIEKWVAAGGTCALCAPQCMMRDDRNATRRRNFKARRNEVLMRLRICRAFHLPWWHYPESVIVPMAKWAMPTNMYDHYHRKAKNRK